MHGSTIVYFACQNIKYAFLSLVEFVEIYMFFGGTKRTVSVVGGPKLILRTCGGWDSGKEGAEPLDNLSGGWW